MNLNDTKEMMKSEDYKERFKSEYFQLKIRSKGLEIFLVRYKNGELPFKPSCSYDLLHGQFKSMELYRTYLEERAIVEDINLQIGDE